MPRVLTQTDVADFRERLCDAATRLFDSRGREGFTMRELASELGVSSAPAIPWSARKATRSSIEGAIAHNSDATPKPPTPSAKMRRSPKMSPREPPSRINEPSVSR